MTEDEYAKINNYCRKNLSSWLHDRHLEDLTQYVAMKHFEANGYRKWIYMVRDYCRMNGIGNSKKVLQGAIAIERSISMDHPDYVEKSTDGDTRSNIDIKGALEEFLLPLNLTTGAREWTLKSYRIKMN